MTEAPRTTETIEELRARVARFDESLRPHQRVWLAQVLLGMVQLADSSAVELAVPVVRALACRRGVAPTERDVDSRLDRWLERTIFSGAPYLPAFGAALSSTVVLRKRSPLWGLALWPLVRLIAVTVLAADASRLAKLHASDESVDDAAGGWSASSR